MELKICNDVEFFSILPVTVPLSALVINVPVIFGNVRVLACVGLANCNSVCVPTELPCIVMVPADVMVMPEVVTAPVIGPAKPEAVTVPATCRAVLGEVVPMPTLAVEPTMDITVVPALPALLTLNCMPAFCVLFCNTTVPEFTNTFKSPFLPSVKGVSLAIETGAFMVEAVSFLTKLVAATPLNVFALVAVPANFAPVIAVDKVIPAVTAGNPAIPDCGVNEVSLIIATNVLLL